MDTNTSASEGLIDHNREVDTTTIVEGVIEYWEVDKRTTEGLIYHLEADRIAIVVLVLTTTQWSTSSSSLMVIPSNSS